MKVLVTGGAGFIGSAVIRMLIRETGAGVVNVDSLTYAGNPASLVFEAQDPGYVFIHADIRDGAAMREVFRIHQPDIVMHLAAESHVDRSIDGPGAFIDTNVTATYTLLEAAREYWASLDAPDRTKIGGSVDG